MEAYENGAWANMISSGGGISGLTSGKIPVATGASSLGDSQLSDSGTQISTGSDTFNVGNSLATARIYLNGSLFAHQTASNINTFVGTGAGSTSATGIDSNSAFGNSALSALSSGAQNTAIGGSALAGVTTGGYNTAVGVGALYGVTTGSSNVAIGTHTGVGIGGTSSGNTFLGESAGSNLTGTSSNNVFIGNRAGPSSAGAVSNTLYIANSAGTPLIYGDFSAGNVGIGMTSPNYTLDVNGYINGTSLSATNSSAQAYTNAGAFTIPLAFLFGPNISAVNNSAADGSGSGMFFSVTSSAGNTQTAWMGAVATAGSSRTPALVFGAQTSASSNAERMRIDSSGNVGIGVTNPSTPLDISGSFQVRGIAADPATASSGNGQIYYNSVSNKFRVSQGGAWADLVSTATGTISGSGTANYVPYFSGPSSISSSPIYINSATNLVGIGTTSPNSPLTISTTSNSQAINISNFQTSSQDIFGVSASVSLDDGGNYTSSQYGADFYATGSGSNDYSVGVRGRSDATNYNSDSIGVWGSAVNGTGVYGNSTGGTGVFALGAVGLSASGSSIGAVISNSSATGTALSVSQGNASGKALSVSGTSYFNGNVGIGQSSPDVRFHLTGGTNSDAITSGYTATPVAKIIDTNGTVGKSALLVATGRNAGDTPVLSVGFKNVVTNAYTSYMEVNGNGNVGVGTTSAPYPLTVSGTVAISASGAGLRFPDSTTQTTAARTQLIGTGLPSPVPAGATVFHSFGFGSTNATEANKQLVMASSGNLEKFYVVTNTAQPATGSLVITVRKNGVDTALTLTIPSSAAAGVYSNTVNSISVSAGDLISISFSNSASTNSAAIVSFSALFY